MEPSFFFDLKEKIIRTVRLALTDVTPAQLMAEEATSGDPLPPDTKTMGIIARAAFEIDDYCRILEILYYRLSRYDGGKNWVESFHALILSEYLLLHGPLSFSKDYQSYEDVIRRVGTFQYKDEWFNWGLAVRKKAERVLELLSNERLLREERDRAQELARKLKLAASNEENPRSGSPVKENKANGAADARREQHPIEKRNCKNGLAPEERQLLDWEDQSKEFEDKTTTTTETLHLGNF